MSSEERWINPDLVLRDKTQRRMAQILGKWDALSQRYADSIKAAVLPEEAIEYVVAECLRYGLFEEARRASMFRRARGLKTSEVDAVLKAVLLKFTPYCPFGIPEASYDRFSLWSYPPFVELVQAASDGFRRFVKEQCL